MTKFVRALDQMFYRKSEFNVFRVDAEYEKRETEQDEYGYSIAVGPQIATGQYLVYGWFTDSKAILLAILSSEAEALSYIESF